MPFLDIAKFKPKILLISVFKIYRKKEFCRNGKKEVRKQTSLYLSFTPTFVIILLFHIKEELFSPTAVFLIWAYNSHLHFR